jgi:putative ABC transport system permease protein
VLGFSRLVVRNLFRSPLRAVMTVMTVAIMLAAFIFPRALVEAQEEQVRQVPNNRINVRPREGWSGTLPDRYVEEIQALPGVERAYVTRVPALRLPGHEKVRFASKAAQMEPFLAMIDELEAPADQKQAFLADERSAFVDETLAAEQGWRLGDRVVFESRFYPGKWELTIACIFRSLREGFGTRTVWLHYDYFNRTLPKDQQDKVNWIVAQVSEPNTGGRVAEVIDAHFDSAQYQTLSMEDRVAAQANLGNFSAILSAMDLVSYLILGVVMSIVGNTLAMNVRERTHEYGVMRAIGFGPRQIGLLVLAEAMLLGLLGAAIGVSISYPLFENLVSRALRDAMSFPPIVIHDRVAWLAVALGVGLSVVAAAAPVYRVAQLRVTDAIRRIG